MRMNGPVDGRWHSRGRARARPAPGWARALAVALGALVPTSSSPASPTEAPEGWVDTSRFPAGKPLVRAWVERPPWPGLVSCSSFWPVSASIPTPSVARRDARARGEQVPAALLGWLRGGWKEGSEINDQVEALVEDETPGSWGDAGRAIGGWGRRWSSPEADRTGPAKEVSAFVSKNPDHPLAPFYASLFLDAAPEMEKSGLRVAWMGSSQPGIRSVAWRAELCAGHAPPVGADLGAMAEAVPDDVPNRLWVGWAKWEAGDPTARSAFLEADRALVTVWPTCGSKLGPLVGQDGRTEVSGSKGGTVRPLRTTSLRR